MERRRKSGVFQIGNLIGNSEEQQELVDSTTTEFPSSVSDETQRYTDSLLKEKESWQLTYTNLKKTTIQLQEEGKSGTCKEFNYLEHLDDDTKEFILDQEKRMQEQSYVLKDLESIVEDIHLLKSSYNQHVSKFNIIQENIRKYTNEIANHIINAKDINVDDFIDTPIESENNCNKTFLVCDSD